MLWEAAWRGKLEMVKYLAERGADIDARGTHYTPYFVEVSCYCVARHRGHGGVARLLLKRGAASTRFARPSRRPIGRWSPFGFCSLPARIRFTRIERERRRRAWRNAAAQVTSSMRSDANRNGTRTACNGSYPVHRISSCVYVRFSILKCSIIEGVSLNRLVNARLALGGSTR